MLQNTKNRLAMTSREVVLLNYATYKYNRNLNASSKYILCSECTRSDSLATKIGEVPAMYTQTQYGPVLPDTDPISNFAFV